MAKKKQKSKHLPKQGRKTQKADAKGFTQHAVLQQALDHHRAGHLPQAEALYKQILSNEPDHPYALYYLGLQAQSTGHKEIAVELMRKAVRIKPDLANAYNHLGIVLHELGRLGEAYECFQQALALQPNFAEVYNNLGYLLMDQGRLEDAADCLRRTIALDPNFAGANYNLGLVLERLNRPEEAVAHYRQALVLRPDLAEGHYQLGKALHALNKPEEAVESYRRAISLRPDYAEAHNDMGFSLIDLDRLMEAEACFRRALSLKPDFAEAHYNLGHALNDQGKPADAVVSFRRALDLKPDYVKARSNLLMCLLYLPTLDPFLYLDEARKFGRLASEKARERFSAWTCTPRPDRLRVGLVSGDLRNHPVGYFLESMLENLDASKIELFAYQTSGKADELTERIRSRFAAWKSVEALDDEAAARLIHTDGLHVLLDLSGHTALHRLHVFAWKPAPVQATWLGYYASTGLAEMDYMIADPVSVPPSHQNQFTEKVWYLPDTRLCFSPPATGQELSPAPLPALHNGYLTFGCFQNLAKINDGVLAAWGKIMQLLPQARLRLQEGRYHAAAIREQWNQRLISHGVMPERVRLEKNVPRLQYLAAYNEVDIVLDTFPFAGATTTCEALWMGVPTVTLAGNMMVSRQGASLLSCAGLSEWVASDVEDYVTKALTHAADLEKLARLRGDLRTLALASPLFDGRRFAGNFEAAMWGMWNQLQARGKAG